MDVRGKKILITGASSGIGAATASLAARKGAHVLLLGRSVPRLQAVSEGIRGQAGKVSYYVVDLRDPVSTAHTMDRIRAEEGVPDIIVNNAGAGIWKYITETSGAEVVDMMSVPYFGAFFVTRAFLPDFLKRGSGIICNVTSVASFLVWPGAAGYTAARWAMRGFTEALRTELEGSGVRTQLIAFAKVKSEYWEHNPGSEERVPKKAGIDSDTQC